MRGKGYLERSNETFRIFRVEVKKILGALQEFS
jgi:hypothetical protein